MFGIKAIGLLISLMIIIQNDNVFNLAPNFLAVLTAYRLYIISFRLALLASSKSPPSPTSRRILAVWREKAVKTREHEYHKLGGGTGYAHAPSGVRVHPVLYTRDMGVDELYRSAESQGGLVPI